MTINQLQRKVNSILKNNNIRKSENTKTKIKGCSNMMTEGFRFSKGEKAWELNLYYTCLNRNIDKDKFENDMLVKMYNVLISEMDESWIELKDNVIILSADE